MFKLKNLYLVLSIFLLGLASCTKDDDTTSEPIASLEGKWQYTKIGTITNNQEILTDYQHAAGCTKDYIEILSGGVLKSHEFNNPNCQETISTGTWTKNNNSLIITYPSQPIINGEILELTNSTLKTKFSNSGIIDLEILTRIQ